MYDSIVKTKSDKKQQKIWTDIFFKGIQMAKWFMEGCLTSLVIRNCLEQLCPQTQRAGGVREFMTPHGDA